VDNRIPRAEEEVEYVACLLSCGGPNWLAPSRTPNIIEPTSSLMYRADCANWFHDNVEPERPHHYAQTYSLIGMDRFSPWWVRYKVWLVENKRD